MNGSHTIAISEVPPLYRPLSVCIDARLPSGGEVGGVEQFVIGLAHALSGLVGSDEEYLFLMNPGCDEWLKPYIGGGCRIIHGPAATRQPGWMSGLRKNQLVRKAARRLLAPIIQSKQFGANLPLPRSDGMIEREGFDLIHFPSQSAFLTSVPSIYQPWDLQHLHLPQYFSSEVIRKRESEYRAFCDQAKMVAVATSWQKSDLTTKYELPEEKVQVVEPGPPTDSYPTPATKDLQRVHEKFSLPPRFVFYPAQTWPHKNHLGLLQAIAWLRDHAGLIVPLVASGRRNEFYIEIERRIDELNLRNQVQFIGFVSPLELQSLYRLCRAVIFPTLFEGFGLPLLEAFSAGAPTACSNVTSLPMLAGEAARIFDPNNPSSIAEAIDELWTKDDLCAQLVVSGRRRAREFNWQRTASLFRAHYRRLTGRPLSIDDRSMLSEPPLV